MNKPTWTKEEDALLTKLWGDGKLSAPEIGRKVGRNKNAVIGRAHRLGLGRKKSGGSKPGRKAKKSIPIPKPKSPKRPGKAFVFKHSTEADRKPPRYVAPTQKWLGSGVHLLDTTYGQCRAILGSSDDARGLAICCGKPIKAGTNLSFCDDHYAEYTTNYWSR